MTQITLDLAASKAARDDGMEQVTLTRQEWLKAALLHADVFLRANRGKHIRFEQVREGIQRYIPEPEHQNQWGAIARNLTKEKKWVEVGAEVAQSIAARGRLTRVYEVTI